MIALAIMVALLLTLSFAQETTGGLQGTVKDEKGALVAKAQVELTGTTLIGAKTLLTDASGYYRFANLPPGKYSIKVASPGFATLKRDGITIEIGHLPSLELTLKVGSQSTVVEVTSEAPLIDVTTSTTATNVTTDVIADVPHGRSFQSVIQFAPSARNEPLAGQAGGTGGAPPGSAGNGLAYGFSVGGAADSENSYLVEGQDTENISGGYSKANVPFEFIQEVQVKTSGIEAEHGGALGGVVNVVMKKGSNNWHGQLFATYESAATDASPHNYLRYDPTTSVILGNPGFDESIQYYQPKEDHFRNIQAGITVGGPIIKDRLWFSAGFAPQYNSRVRNVDFSSQGAGVQAFNQDQQTYYGVIRLDAALTSKIRVFGSWLSQSARQSGASFPNADAKQGYLNYSTITPLVSFNHGIAWYAPNQTFNVGGDITITPRLISTTRFGYFFENYHDNGWQKTNPNYLFEEDSVGGTDAFGNPLPTALQQYSNAQTSAFNANNTQVNANKHYQFDQDFAWFKSGLAGTHNFKFGYQFNRLSNVINQYNNVPYANTVIGQYNYSAGTAYGAGQCATLTTTYGGCYGQYGWIQYQDFGTHGAATDNNHALFVQDAWTLGKGVTINAGLRIEKETLPTPAGAVALTGHDINFSWGDKIEPRLGGAWDIKQNGKYKLFASYGVTNDIMKLLVAQSSWGAQWYEDCAYAFNSPATLNSLDPVFVNDHVCPVASSSTGINWGGGVTPAGMSLIENVNYRPWEPVINGVKPYRQHESVAGLDTQLRKNLSLEVRWDRHRLDHVIEDMSLSDPYFFEIYAIGNPGEGVNKTIDGYSTYLNSLGQAYGVPGQQFNIAGEFGTCPTCPNNPKAVRSYDGLEFRLNKTLDHHWMGMVSYTWSSLRGNYTGLTTTDQSDGGNPGRNSPNTTRSFDEPFYYFTADGKSGNGPLPTDRPNTLKGYVYYTQNWGKRQSTTVGIFQVAYQGTPVTTYADLGFASSSPVEATYLFGRGKWVDATQDGSGNITIGDPYTKRTPWYTQSDLNFKHDVKINPGNSAQVVSFEATISNLFNQQAVTSYYQGLNAIPAFTALYPHGYSVFDGAPMYNAYENGYNAQQTITNSGVILSNQYGKANLWQQPRTIRFALRYTF
jgi:hypothetical protein